MKVYAVKITLDGENKGLLPSMSAEAALVIGERPKCLQVPVSALIGKTKEPYCFVFADNQLHVRKVIVGVTDGNVVEITSGLKEGDLVLRNPSAVVGRLTDSLRPYEK